MAAQNDIYNKYQNDLKNTQKQQEERYKAMQEAEAGRIRAQTENQIRQYEAQKPVIEQSFTDNAQNAYVNKMQSQKELPQLMAAQGYNGGLSESSNIRLDTNYGNAYNGYKRDYDKNLRGIQSQIDNANYQMSDLLSQNSNRYNAMLSDNAADYNRMLAEASKEQQMYQLQQQAQAKKESQEFTRKQTTSNSKPRLTLKEAHDAYSNGIKTKNVTDTLKYYYGDDYGSGDGTMGNEEYKYNYKDENNKTIFETRIVVPGYGPITPTQLDSLVNANKVKETVVDGKYYYEKV